MVPEGGGWFPNTRESAISATVSRSAPALWRATAAAMAMTAQAEAPTEPVTETLPVSQLSLKSESGRSKGRRLIGC